MAWRCSSSFITQQMTRRLILERNLRSRSIPCREIQNKGQCSLMIPTLQVTSENSRSLTTTVVERSSSNSTVVLTRPVSSHLDSTSPLTPVSDYFSFYSKKHTESSLTSESQSFRPPVENWVAQLLPARSFGKIILTTSAGIMDHEEARRKHVSYYKSLDWDRSEQVVQ